MGMNKKLAAWLQILALLVVVIGGGWGAVAYFAKASDLRYTDMRLDHKILIDQLRALKVRIWDLERKNEQKPPEEWTDQRDVRQRKELDHEQKQIQNEVDVIMKEMRKKK